MTDNPEIGNTIDAGGIATNCHDQGNGAPVLLLHGSGPVSCDLQAMGRLLQREPGDQPPPNLSSLLVMSPGESYMIDFKDPVRLAQAYATPDSQGAHYYEFACSPPPGKEFATLEVRCDIEQNKLNYGGQFSCWIKPETGRGRMNLGDIGWPKDTPAGRKTITEHVKRPGFVGKTEADLAGLYLLTFRGMAVTHQAYIGARLEEHEIGRVSQAADLVVITLIVFVTGRKKLLLGELDIATVTQVVGRLHDESGAVRRKSKTAVQYGELERGAVENIQVSFTQ